MSRRSVRSATGALACALALPIGLLASACEPAPPRPANDDFGAAVRLPSTAQGQIAGSTLGGTLQPGESRTWGPTSVWYRWVAPSSGVVDIKGGSPLGTFADVYTGATYRTLRPVPTSMLSSTGNQFAVTAGTTYTFRVASQFGGSFVLHWDTTTTPANDNRQRAAALTSATGSLVVDATAATRQPSDPTIEGQRIPASVWYRWTAPATGWFSFGTAGSRSSAAIGAFSDDGALTRLDESAGSCGSPYGGIFGSGGSAAATVGFSAQAGRSYLLMLGSLPFAAGLPGGLPPGFPGPGPEFGDRLQLNWRLVPDAPTASGNDAFAAAARLTGTNGTVEGTTAGATAQAGEPAHGGKAAQSSVWFTITPRVTADYLFQASPQDSDGCYSRIGVYTGTAVNRLTPVPPSSRPSPLAQLNDAQLSTPGLSDPDLEIPEAYLGRRVHLVAGKTYSIAVDRIGDAAPFSLHWDIPQAVPAIRSVTTGNGSIGVIWSPPAATAGSRRAGYFVTAVPVDTDDDDDSYYTAEVSVPVTSSFTNVRGLKNGKAYRLIVAAVNDAGPGDLFVSRPVTPRR